MLGMFRFSVAVHAIVVAVLFMSLLLVALASPARAGTTFTVEDTGDARDADTSDGACGTEGDVCTLRAAIEQANATTGEDEISFGISGDGPHTISPASSLPTIIDPVVIDGYTQDGASPATDNSAATLKIELDGSGAGDASGLTIGPNGGGSTVRGLAINRFSGFGGIHLLSDGNAVEGNHIGTDVAGTSTAGTEEHPNAFAGVLIDGGFDTTEHASNDNTIGGTTAAARNIISGNDTYGVWIRGTFEEADSASGNEVLGNYIGTDASGTERLVNGDPGNGFGGSSGSGVEIRLGVGNTIGGTTAGARNILSGNGAYGVHITAVSSNNKVQGNYIGTDVSGTDSITNEQDGVRISNRSSANVIGGTVEGAGNVISGNNSTTSFYSVSQPNTGVTIRDANTSGNKVQGNYIGTDKDGAAPLGNSERNEPDRVFFTGNGQFGVRILNSPDNIIGGTEPGARNVISGNLGVTQQNGVTGTGLKIEGSSATGNKVQGNYIGTDVSGTEAVRNVLDGVVVEDATNNTIGGAEEGARNVISGNQYDGIAINGVFADASGNEVQGNYIGVDATGEEALPNATGLGTPSSGVTLRAPGNIIGGTEDGEGNVISGNGKAGVEEGGGNGIIIVAPDADPAAASGNVIQGNFIGTDKDGAKALKNGRCGIAIRASDTIVGGAGDGAGNVISANHNDGIEIIGETSSGNVVEGNRFGTDVSGTEDLGNGGDGVDIIGAPNNTVGGTEDGAGNLLSGNGISGVEISGETASGNEVLGNFAGTNAEGTEALGNGFFGVFIEDASDNTIGGTEEGAGNLLSGNDKDGIQIFEESATGNVVEGNLIGTNASGTEALGNLLAGASIARASGNTIGGTEPGAGNVISANVQEGVFIGREAATGNEVLGNFIGTNEAGTEDLGNGRDGIRIADSAGGNNIGGANGGAENIVAHSGGAGVRLPESAAGGNAILRNSIFSNGGLGIDLGAEGVTGNDKKDVDEGSNNLQNYPVLGSVTRFKKTTIVKGTLNSAPRTAFTVRFFSIPERESSGHGEGKTYLGKKQMKTDAKGNASFIFSTNVPGVDVMTATATGPDGNTSEFSETRPARER